MKSNSRALFLVAFLAGALVSGSCSGQQPVAEGGYPDFITSNEDYYVTRIGSVPEIDEETYRLKVSGLVDNPREFTLAELGMLDLVEVPLTIECIGNAPEGPLLSTAVWRGFNLYDFLMSLGMDDRATGVRYRAADGYYASHTIDQLKNNGVVGALYMNDEVIPALHGFPLRILNPGYHGVKQPAWVTEIEAIDMPIKDYWEDRGWDCSPPMAIDSTIFFPDDGVRVRVGTALEIGGAAFGGTRVKTVELTIDDGVTWQKAEIVKSMDADNVWVFWRAELVFSKSGRHRVNVRSTDARGNSQPEDDPDKYDGANDWPVLTVNVTD